MTDSDKPTGENKAILEETPETEQQAASDSGQGSSEGAEATGQDIARLQSDVEHLREQVLRTAADFDNFRKRSRREVEETVRHANAALLTKLIPVLDNFELGLSAAGSEPAAEGVVKGMEMVRHQFHEFLREAGVETIEAEGQPFDPNYHEAMGQQPDPAVPEGHVIKQLRKGYLLHGRLLRPSNVLVSAGPPPEGSGRG